MSRHTKCIFVMSLLAIPASIQAAASNCYVRLPATDGPVSVENRQLIESYGGRIIHEFPPSEFLCWMEPSQFEKFTHDHPVEAEHHDTGIEYRKRTGHTTDAYSCWSYIQEAHRLAKSMETFPVNKGAAGDSRAAAEPPPHDVNIAIIAADQRSVSRTEIFSTNYLIGKSAVCLVLPESHEHALDWTSAEMDTAIGQVVFAYDIMPEVALEHNVDVSWVCEIHRAVPVFEEPIEHKRPSFHGVNWAFGWIDDVLRHLGESTEWGGLFNNGNQMRKTYQTDWGCAYFVVNNSPGQTFDDGVRGYTYKYWVDGTTETFRCPFAVSTYYRGDYAAVAHRTVAHETLHMYGAVDE